MCKGLLCASFSVLPPQALSPEPQPLMTVLGWVACVPHTPSLITPVDAALLAPTCPGLHPHLPAVQCTQVLPNPKGSSPKLQRELPTSQHPFEQQGLLGFGCWVLCLDWKQQHGGTFCLVISCRTSSTALSHWEMRWPITFTCCSLSASTCASIA